MEQHNHNRQSGQERTYRVIETFRNWFKEGPDKEEERIKWQGTDIDELSQLHPPSNVFGVDDLKYHELEDGYLKWWYRFELQQPDGTWTECEDPRRRLPDSEFDQIEYEAEQYNRWKFPGDYLDEDDSYDEYDDYDEYDGWDEEDN